MSHRNCVYRLLTCIIHIVHAPRAWLEEENIDADVNDDCIC